MKRLLFILIVAALVANLGACEQAQQALDTIDKAKLLKDDFEKKTSELKKKATELMPGGSWEGSSKKGGNEKRDDKERDERGDN